MNQRNGGLPPVKRDSLIVLVLGDRNARWRGWGCAHVDQSCRPTCTPAGVVALIESCSGLRTPLLDD